MSEASANAAPFRSLSVKFFRFTSLLVLWIVIVILAYDINQGNFNPSKGLLLCTVVLMVSWAIARFTIKQLIKPIRLLQIGMEEVGRGNLERIKFAKTGDEIEFLGKSFNGMIERLIETQTRLVQQHEELEQKVHERTQALEEAMQKAMEASGAKSEFLANMSHELRTPMNGLLGMIELSLDAPASAEQQEQLETAQRCALSLLALVNDVLDLSKIESGKMALEKISFPLANQLEDTLKGHELKARQKGVLLDWKFAPSMPDEVVGDPLRLRQIVNNLVSNSIKFTDEGAIEVRVAAFKGTDPSKWNVELHVIDTGAGIPQDKIATIFEKFTQADGSISRRYGGTGLGLAITKRLVDLHNGSISAESELGLGSKFSVLLEYDVAVAPVVVLAPVETESKGSEGSTSRSKDNDGIVLLVEDNIVNQKVVMAVLKKRGYEIDLASNGEEALVKLEQRSYAVVLMDVQMPVLDGLETTRRMRLEERWKDIPVIAMTAHAMNGDKEKCLAAGMNAYISKPVHSAHLLATIEAYTSRPVKKLTAAPVDDLMKPFLSRANDGLAQLRKSLDNTDLATLEEQVGYLRQAAEAISATGIVECAKRVEIAVASKNTDDVMHSLLLLEGEITRLNQQTVVTSFRAG